MSEPSIIAKCARCGCPAVLTINTKFDIHHLRDWYCQCIFCGKKGTTDSEQDKAIFNWNSEQTLLNLEKRS